MTGPPSAGRGPARRALVTRVSGPARTFRARAVLGVGLVGGLVVASIVGSLLIRVSQLSDRAPPTPWDDGSTLLSAIRAVVPPPVRALLLSLHSQRPHP